MKFKYKKYGPNVVRPVIPIELKFKNQSIRYEALVDSGADICIFDSQIGEALGMDIYDGLKQSVTGITGNPQYYYVNEIILSVGGFEHRIEVGFSPNISTDGYGVLGQKGFFDKFVVKFDYKKQELEIKGKS